MDLAPEVDKPMTPSPRGIGLKRPRPAARTGRPAAADIVAGRRRYLAASSRAWRSLTVLYSDSISTRPPEKPTAGISAT